VAVHGIGLCAGIGGFELALDLALRDYRPRLLCEWDAFASSVLVARMEEKTLAGAPIWSDCRSLGRDELGQAGILDIEEPIIVNAGFPCQPHSQAGSRKHAQDERWLWFDILRVANECAAEWLVFENVEGILSKNGPWDEILRSLAESGFDAIYDVYSAAGVGAPQARRRVFLVAKRISHTRGLPLRDFPERREGAAPKAHGRDSELGDVGLAVADSSSKGLERREQQVLQGTGRREEGGTAPEFREAPLADTDSQRLEVQRIEERPRLESTQRFEPNGCDQDWGFPWPPGPSDTEGWGIWQESGGPSPSVRRDSDGASSQLEFSADRLRTLGNGLVPVVAARAIRSLARRAGWAD